MAITYHAGRRIQGLSTDETTITPTGYKVHTFNSTGTFTITAGSGSGDVLIIGGGGSGGGAAGGNYGSGGGGGAGDFRKFTNQTLSSGSVVIGNGGSQVASATNGNGGGSSSYNGNSSGGGGGGRNGNTSSAGGTGASGGGGSGDNTGSAGGSSNAVGFGNTGGQGGSKATAAAGGGGGGAGSTGTAGNVQDGGNGGDGKSDSINGTLTFYAAGGGGGRVSAVGGIGGSSIGGNGGFGGIGGGTAGLANTGSGGGGGGSGGATSTNIGLAGGQGVVIISYLNDGSITATGGTITTPSTTTTGVKPTNAQVGSRFEETDTRKMYSLVPATPIAYETDFTTQDSFTDDAPNVNVDTANGWWYLDDSGNADVAGGGRTITEVDDEKWLVTFKTTFFRESVNDSNNVFGGFGLSDGVVLSSSGSKNFIGMYFSVDRDAAGSPCTIVVQAGSNTYAVNGTANTGEIANETHISDGSTVTWWGRLKRISSTQATLELFDDEAMTSPFGLSPITVTIPSNCTGLNYVYGFGGRISSGNQGTLKIDNIKIYNGVTSMVVQGWQEIGT
jgi:hypothetical protein